MKSTLLRARALVFVALSGVAVPACQHYETSGRPERDQARTQLTAPTSVGAVAPSSSAHRPAQRA